MPPGGKNNGRQFSVEERIKLLDATALFGPKWTKIKKLFFPDRTTDSIRNCFIRIIKSDTSEKKKYCSKCGLKKRGHICGIYVVKNNFT